jgi:chromosome segregation ATPase
MFDSTDMSTPVTRGELRAEFKQFEIRLEQKLAQLATKAELESWGGALQARMLEHIDRSEQRLLVELARHISASFEKMSRQISTIDDKYADLRPRVSRLETKVFPLKRR